VVIQRAFEAESVSLFRIDSGVFSGPALLSLQQQLVPGGKSPSMEARVQEVLGTIPSRPLPGALEAMEHLAILRRWYYRSSRAGEIFFADEKGVLPWRRIVRGISRVYRGEKPEPEAVVAIDPARQ
jgi:hypothetical protein